jgi:hypothetical protein
VVPPAPKPRGNQGLFLFRISFKTVGFRIIFSINHIEEVHRLDIKKPQLVKVEI